MASGACWRCITQHADRRTLRYKWLSSPDSDLKKTLREVARQRERTPSLVATLVLTTNQEPGTQLVHDVETAGHDAGMEIRVWPSSALADFLDFDPKGQWIRRAFLGVEPTNVSEELLCELSERSIELAPTVEDPELWVDRKVDQELTHRVEDRVQFVLGESGVGKVSCVFAVSAAPRPRGVGSASS